MAAVGPALARCARYSEKMVDPGVHQASAAVLPCVVVIQSRKRCSRTTRPRSRGGLQLSERCQKLSLAQVLELARNLVPLAASITHHEVDLVNRVDGARHTETGCRSRQPRRSPSHSSTGARMDSDEAGARARRCVVREAVPGNSDNTARGRCTMAVALASISKSAS